MSVVWINDKEYEFINSEDDVIPIYKERLGNSFAEKVEKYVNDKSKCEDLQCEINDLEDENFSLENEIDDLKHDISLLHDKLNAIKNIVLGAENIIKNIYGTVIIEGYADVFEMIDREINNKK